LEVDGKDGAWYDVTVNDQSGKAVTGYIHNTVVEVTGADENEAEVKPRTAVRREAPRARAAKQFAGGGVELQTGGMNLLFEARYNLGLSNQAKDPAPGEYVKVTALTFILGVKF
jgi:hypothetical protein